MKSDPRVRAPAKWIIAAIVVVLAAIAAVPAWRAGCAPLRCIISPSESRMIDEIAAIAPDIAAIRLAFPESKARISYWKNYYHTPTVRVMIPIGGRYIIHARADLELTACRSVANAVGPFQIVVEELLSVQLDPSTGQIASKSGGPGPVSIDDFRVFLRDPSQGIAGTKLDHPPVNNFDKLWEHY